MLTLDTATSLFFYIVIVGFFAIGLMLITGLAYLFSPSMRDTIKQDWNRKP